MNKKVKEFLDNSSNYEVVEYIGNLQQENKQLKAINKEYERLDNGEPRGCIITRVDEYDIYDLIKCKNNWYKLKEIMESETRQYFNEDILRIMKKIEKGEKINIEYDYIA